MWEMYINLLYPLFHSLTDNLYIMTTSTFASFWYVKNLYIYLFAFHDPGFLNKYFLGKPAKKKKTKKRKKEYIAIIIISVYNL